jgi:hypothetical protein
MEKPPVQKSRSALFNLSQKEELEKYIKVLDKIANNNHKYIILNNQIQNDNYGDPFVIMHYIDMIGEEERSNNKIHYSAEILNVPGDLDRFDTLMEKIWSKEIILTFLEDFKHQEKDFFYMYKLIFYYKTSPKTILKKDTFLNTMPVASK